MLAMKTVLMLWLQTLLTALQGMVMLALATTSEQHAHTWFHTCTVVVYCCSRCDLPAFQQLWDFLQTRVFARLDSESVTLVAKLLVSLHRYYLVTASQNRRLDLVHEFFKTNISPPTRNTPVLLI